MITENRLHKSPFPQLPRCLISLSTVGSFLTCFRLQGLRQKLSLSFLSLLFILKKQNEMGKNKTENVSWFSKRAIAKYPTAVNKKGREEIDLNRSAVKSGRIDEFNIRSSFTFSAIRLSWQYH